MIHIHNGDSTATAARQANIPGHHVPFKETLITGPARAGLSRHDWIEERACFLAENYDQNLLRTRNELLAQEQMIDQARREDEVVLWFEHDLFCMINLLYLFGRLGKARRLALVWSSRPLGAMDESEWLDAHQARATVSHAMLRIGSDAWDAYVAGDATALNRFVSGDFAEFPFLRDGFRLHASRFPSMRNGLGEVERRALEGIAEGATEFNSLFARFDQNPPRFGLGDGEFLRHLRRLTTCAVPVITISEVPGERPPKALFTLTPAGQNVLDGKADFIELNNAGFWLGGAHLTRERMWRWDEQRQEVLPSGGS